MRTKAKYYNFVAPLFVVTFLWGENRVFQIEARFTDRPPVIDGYIENLWSISDSIYNFVQTWPREGEPSTEKTIAYILYDKNALYIAFKCYQDPSKLSIRLAKREDVGGDYVSILLSPFLDNESAYCLLVNAAGVEYDCYISDDGRNWDSSWDGAWRSASRITEHGYNVEIAIPFRSIRFPQKNNMWNINLFRFISSSNEIISWVPQNVHEGIRVSKSGVLNDIHFSGRAFHLEAYPVLLIRHDTEMGKSKNYLSGGGELMWFPTTNSKLLFTIRPDFAQIEADPYRINLSKYELFYEERRPFFLESKYIFTTPLKTFYTRKIGKKLYDGSTVPIMFAGKYLLDTKGVDMCFLVASTDSQGVEPEAKYAATRITRQVFKNSSVGIGYVSKMANQSFFNDVFSVDGEFRTSELEIQGQLAHSRHKDYGTDYAEYLRINYSGHKIVGTAKLNFIGDKFNVDEIGYIPWRGTKSLEAAVGPRFYSKSGLLRLFQGMLGYRTSVEIGDPGWSPGLYSSGYMEFKNFWNLNLNIWKDYVYVVGRWYTSRGVSFSLSTNWQKKMAARLSLWRGSGYNYRRRYFAWNANWGVNFQWVVSPQLRLTGDFINYIEYRPDNTIEKSSWILHPVIVDFAIRKNLILRIYPEVNTDNNTNYVSGLLSYNFRPKSWIYLGWNELRDTSEFSMDLLNRIFVVKIKYLMLF